MTDSQAEEYYGLRYARQALEIDPTYRPAQVIFLSLALEKAYERAGLDQPIDKGSPTIRDLLRTVNSELLVDVLERSLSDHRSAIALGAIKALGDLTDVRATRLKVTQAPALVKALNYGDRRVQMAAADALLRIPVLPPPQSSGRVVEILRRALAADAVPKALLADANVPRAEAFAKAIKELGYESILVQNAREAMRKLEEASDIDVIFVDQALPDHGGNFIPYQLAQMRTDVNIGQLPLFILISPDKDGHIDQEREITLRRYAERYRNTWVLRTTLDPEVLKKRLPGPITEALGKSLTAEERKNFAAEAMVWLKRISTGEVAGYDARPAEAVILRALQSETLRPLAIEAVRGLPGKGPQRELAALVLTKDLAPEMRNAAAAELSRHIQQHGLVLERGQIKALVDLFQTVEDPKLKGNVALVVGSMRPTAKKTGARLQGYIPPPPAPAEEKEGDKPKEKEKADDKAKDKDKEKEDK
jgi:CheY-like chemotaxis protein